MTINIYYNQTGTSLGYTVRELVWIESFHDLKISVPFILAKQIIMIVNDNVVSLVRGVSLSSQFNEARLCGGSD